MATRRSNHSSKPQGLLSDIRRAKTITENPLSVAFRVDDLTPQPLDFDNLLNQIK